MRHFGRSRALRRPGALRAVFVLTVLVLGGGTLIGAAGAVGDTASMTTPFPYEGENSCTGETFAGTGNLHFLVSESVSTSGVIRSHLNVRIDGLQAVTPTGTKYVVQDIFNHEFVIGPATEDTFDVTAHFVRVGEDGSLVLGDDFYEYLRAHITANANGIVTAVQVSTNDMPCQ
jgi:hypothetical protein